MYNDTPTGGMQLSNSHQTCYSNHDIHVDNFGFTLSSYCGSVPNATSTALGLLMTPEKINDTSIQIAL